MPLPTPDEGEGHDDFISRCMGDDNAVEEFPDESQRRAVCERQWEKEDKAMAGLKMIKNAKEKSADIWIYQDIGDGWFEGFTAKKFAEDIKSLGEVDLLNIFINSPGGDVFDGVAIYNILRRHSARIIVEVDALAASIASLIAMAGDEIRMAENALMMIHNPWGMAIGDSAAMRRAADDMDKVRDNSILPAYTKKTGMVRDEIALLMDEETWMSAAEAKELGFIDEISAEKKMAAHVDAQKYHFFKRIPDEVKNTVEKPKEKKTAKPKEKKPQEKKFVRLEDWKRRIKYR